ncbi:hypothetical protein HDV00_006959 [Rhizophlyctis rosea]|nr:hypothetical protein HDV00_006959 [Rhizophlyctis rosea]
MATRRMDLWVPVEGRSARDFARILEKFAPQQREVVIAVSKFNKQNGTEYADESTVGVCKYDPHHKEISSLVFTLPFGESLHPNDAKSPRRRALKFMNSHLRSKGIVERLDKRMFKKHQEVEDHLQELNKAKEEDDDGGTIGLPFVGLVPSGVLMVETEFFSSGDESESEEDNTIGVIEPKDPKACSTKSSSSDSDSDSEADPSTDSCS